MFVCHTATQLTIKMYNTNALLTFSFAYKLHHLPTLRDCIEPVHQNWAHPLIHQKPHLLRFGWSVSQCLCWSERSHCIPRSHISQLYPLWQRIQEVKQSFKITDKKQCFFFLPIYQVQSYCLEEMRGQDAFLARGQQLFDRTCLWTDFQFEVLTGILLCFEVPWVICSPSTPWVQKTE